jgi:hypothetical protein
MMIKQAKVVITSPRGAPFFKVSAHKVTMVAENHIWLWHISGGFSPASHCCGPVPALGKVMWDFW